MYFKCDITKITAEQLAACTAISTLYSEQSMPSVVVSLDPITFELKPHLSATMRERLIVNRVPVAVLGYQAEIKGNELVVSKAEAAKPRRKSRKGTDTSNTDIQES